MKVPFYFFFSFILVITIFITIFQNQNIIINTSEYIWPTPMYRQISSYFGYREKPTGNASSYHQGVDVLAPEGSGVLAIEEGTVLYAGWSTYGGYMLKIKHPKGIVSFYEHLAPQILVNEGDWVAKGETVARVGPKYVENGKLNGATTGVHLHFGMMKDGKYVNPLEYY